MPTSTWTVSAVPDEVAHVRRALTRFAEGNGVPSSRLGDLALAVTEAVTNAVIHAFRTADRPGTITVTATVTPAAFVEVVVRDDGMGMSPRDDSPGLGLGLSLISTLADETDHRQPPDGVGFEVWMRFRFAAA